MSSIMREDWIECELGEICFTTSGGTPSRNRVEFYQGSIPWVKSGELDKGIIYDTEEHISEEAIKNSSAKIFPEGTLLIALYGATIGKLAFLGVEAATNQAICGIYKSSAIEEKYLFNFLLNRRQKLISQGTGGAQPNISQTILKNLSVPLAPLPIQRAIVSKIEALFSDLDNGIANFRKAQEQLKMYRQAVLKKAFEGKLSELGKVGLKDDKMTDGENEEILPSQNPKNHNSDIKEDNLPKGWKWVKLGDVIIKIEAGKSFRCEERPPINNEVGVLKVSAVTWEEFSEVESKTIISDDKVNEAYFVKQGDFLFSRANTLELVGRSVIVNKIQKRLMLSDKTLRFQFSTDINPFYILYFLRTQSGRKQIESLSTGNQMSMRNIGQSRIKQIVFPLCSLPEQTQIVQEIESRLSVCDKMEQSISESIEKAEALRQSILKKAFEGKLLSETEIAQCKAAVDYEPAGELLKKIQAEKVKTRLIASQQKKKGGKNGK